MVSEQTNNFNFFFLSSDVTFSRLLLLNTLIL